MIPDENRVTDIERTSVNDMIVILTNGHPGAVTVLLKWLSYNPVDAVPGMLTIIDGKRLYGGAIWDVFCLCGQDIERFLYHIAMELPNQATGEFVLNAARYEVDLETHRARRTHGSPGSYWALEQPPTDPDYTYPII